MTDEDLLSAFRREANGNWTCIKPVLIDGSVRNVGIMPGTTIFPADMYMGMDLARELEAAANRLHH